MNSNVVRVSPLLFYHPSQWVFAHEIAHGRFWHEPLKTKSQRDLAHYPALERGRTVGKKFEDFRIELASFSEFYDFATAAGLMSEEVPADLMLWDSLSTGDPHDTDRLFWFIHGPGLVFTHRHILGSQKMRKGDIRPLILRFFFLAKLLSGDTLVEHSLMNDLFSLLEKLKMDMAVAPPGDLTRREPEPASDRGSTDYVVRRLECLREDLNLSRNEWQIAVEGLLTSIDILLDPVPRQKARATELLGKLGAWLRWTIKTREKLRPQQQRRDTLAIWEHYRSYLAAMVQRWPASDPWLPFLPPSTISQVDPKNHGFPDVAINPRGGFHFNNGKDAADYRQATFEFLLRLDDLGRESRFRKLSRYFKALIPD